MAEVQTNVSDVSIGNAVVGIDCINLKCVESVDFTISMEEVPIVCDAATGATTYLRLPVPGEVTIVALNRNSTTLQYALDAAVSTKAAAETVSCEEHQITWTPDSETTPTEWTATVILNSPEIADVTVYTDSDCTLEWENAATPENTETISGACVGEVTLTTDDVDETDSTLYFAYTHNTEAPNGTTVIKPAFSTFADDHKLIILHRNATTCNLERIKFWRAQILPDFTQRWDNTNAPRTVPIKLRILSDYTNHPCAPFFQIEIIDKDDSEAADFVYDINKDARACIEC